ncbi:MAG: hypothetical protein RLY87_2234 [Chloroflexota bacterium]|jgi:ankyrin repeat protein
MQQVIAAQQNDTELLSTLPLTDEQGLILADDNGVSLALHAVYYGHRTLAEWIVAHCAALDPYTAAALNDTASLSQHLERDRRLLSAYSGDGFQLLGLACFFDASDAVALLLRLGANPSTPSQNAFSVAPLHSATAANSLVCVELLIAAGADVNAIQRGGFRPIHAAAQHGNVAILRLLIAAGADTTALTNDNKTALDYAITAQHSAACELLRTYSV